MAWRNKFNLGVTQFQAGRHEQAVFCFTQAIAEEGGSSQYIIYDSRGSAFEQLKRLKDALLDAKTTIKLAPDQWHGYARSARLFSQAGKLDASLQMADLALARMKPQHVKRRVEMEKLKEEVKEKKAVATAGKENMGGNIPIAPLSPESKRASKMRQEYIAALPIELLGEIFHEVIEVDSTYLITMLKVCRSWRVIIESTPYLWDTLILTQRSPRKKLRRWLKHSGGRIRNLQVHSSASDHLDWPFEELKHIRWKGLQTMKSNEWSIFADTKTDITPSFPSLQELGLGPERVEGMKFHPVGESMYTTLGPSDAFHSLTLYNMEFNWELIATHFTNLTKLHLHKCRMDGPDFILPALAANARLQTLIIESWPIPVWSSIAKQTKDKVILEALRTVKMGGHATANLLECLKTPALADLELYGYGEGNHLLDHLVSQALPLERISLTQTPTSGPKLLDFITRSPQLQQLELSGLSGTVNKILEALAEPLKSSSSSGQKEYPCPALTHVNVSSNSDVQTGTVVRLVRSRLPPTPATEDDSTTDEQPKRDMNKITTLKIDGCERIDAQWLPWLRENVSSVSCIYATKKKAGWKR